MGCSSSKEDGQEVATFERSEPLLDFDCKGFEYGGVQVAQCAVQGWRKTMEDVALVHFGVSPREDTLALGVFDGHSGGDAAQFAKENLLGHIKETDEWKRGDVKAGCIHGFMEVDVDMRKHGVQSGTTAVLALLSPEEIVVANCGDSRSVLSRGGRQLPMSVDHKPGRKAESRRILRSGGYLDETDPRHPRVVCDSLKMSIATSRALGDFDFKSNPSRPPEEQMVSPVPELYTRERDPHDHFLVLATDGVWDVMDNPEIVSFLQMEAARIDRYEEEIRALDGGESGGDAVGGGFTGGVGGETGAEVLARAVLQRCLELGSRDNMTIVLADLRQRRSGHGQQPPPQALPLPSPPTGEARATPAKVPATLVEPGSGSGAVGACREGAAGDDDRGGAAAAAVAAAARSGPEISGGQAPATSRTASAMVAGGLNGELGPGVDGDGVVGGGMVGVSRGGGDPAAAAAAAAPVAPTEAGVVSLGGRTTADSTGVHSSSASAGGTGGGSQEGEKGGVSATKPCGIGTSRGAVAFGDAEEATQAPANGGAAVEGRRPPQAVDGSLGSGGR